MVRPRHMDFLALPRWPSLRTIALLGLPSLTFLHVISQDSLSSDRILLFLHSFPTTASLRVRQTAGTLDLGSEFQTLLIQPHTTARAIFHIDKSFKKLGQTLDYHTKSSICPPTSVISIFDLLSQRARRALQFLAPLLLC